MLPPEKKNLNYIFLVFAFLFIFGIGFLAGKNQAVCRVCAPEQVDFSLFWEAWNKLSEKYVNPEKLNQEKMIYGAISGMVNSLGDAYTTFFPPPEAQRFLEEVSGQFEGIGIEIGIKKGQVQVISPLEGTQAKRAGLRAGDIIIKVDDKIIADLAIEEVIKLIKGPKGTEVKLTMARDGWTENKDFKIKRDVIKIPSLKWELISENGESEQNKNIAYIKIFQFSEKASLDFSKAANEILRSGAEKIVLDLRDNPGGYLEVAQEIAGWFLERGQIVTSEDFNKKKETIYFKAEGNSRLLNYPVVIIINQGTASASEILAAALRDNKGVKITGTTSFGKGSVQELEYLAKKSSLKITVANWLTPKGSQINSVGLEPDVKVEMTENDYEAQKDPQLEKALEILREIR
jgi:carboxyl-terminal processing protease